MPEPVPDPVPGSTPEPFRHPRPPLPPIPRKKRTVSAPEVMTRSVIETLVNHGRPGPVAHRPLLEEDKASLNKVLKMDVEQFRTEFAQQLRETAAELLAITRRDLELTKPDNRFFGLSILIDKAASLEARNTVSNASVNIQVNNYGPTSKEAILATLYGRETASAPIQSGTVPVSAPVPGTGPEQSTEPKSVPEPDSARVKDRNGVEILCRNDPVRTSSEPAPAPVPGPVPDPETLP